MKILIIKLSSIGDLFHALPAVHNLKTGLNAEVHWVTSDAYVELVKCFSDVDRVIPFYRKSFFRNYSSFAAELKKDEYDIVIDLQGLFKSGFVAGLARGKRKIGPSFKRELAGMFYQEVAGTYNKKRHAVEENLDIVEHLGLNRVDPCFPVEFPDYPLEAEGIKIGVVPVSRWETKNWPAHCYVDVMKRLADVLDITFYLLGAPDDREVCSQIAAGAGEKAVNMAGKSSLVEMGGILKQMDLLLSNDSGPVHMAAAAGTRTLAVFGPTDALRTGPFGEGHKIITAGMDCQPCFSRSCRRDGIPCLKGVTPEKVTEAALEILK